MRPIILLVSLLFIEPVFGYTVVLKNGKTIEGHLVGEHPSTIQIRDQQGIVLSFKRDVLDLAVMQEMNQKAEKPRKAHLVIYWNSQPPAPQKSVVELAKELRSARTGSARSVSEEDLAAAPEISVFAPYSYSQKADKPAAPSEDKPGDGSKLKALQKELDLLLKQKAKADTACARARQQMTYQQIKPSKEARFITPFEEPAVCVEARELQERIKRQEWLLSETPA